MKRLNTEVPFSRSGKLGRIACLAMVFESGNLMVIVSRQLLFGAHTKHCRTDQRRNVAGFTGSLDSGKVWEH